MRTLRRLAVLNILSTAILMLIAMPTLFGQNTDSLNLHKESHHFAYYSTRADRAVLDSLEVILEANYSRITDRLGIQIGKKTKVKVYPDIKSFHAAINYPEAPDWVVGSCIDDELLMVSPLNPGSIHTYQSLMQVIVHEFVHIAVYYARLEKESSSLPLWLNEGYAQYEAGQINDVIRRSVKSSLKNNALPTWAQLETASAMNFGQMNGYGLSVAIVEFLVVTYGIDKLVLLIKKPENIEIIYGVPKNILEKQWIDYLEAAR